MVYLSQSDEGYLKKTTSGLVKIGQTGSSYIFVTVACKVMGYRDGTSNQKFDFTEMKHVSNTLVCMCKGTDSRRLTVYSGDCWIVYLAQ